MSSIAASTTGSVKRHGSGPLPGSGHTSRSERGSSVHSSETGLHGHYHHGSHLMSADPEWEAKEEMRLRELEEARARAAQMEKTMRWWSDCTANWREKWSKVRTERNKVREELRILRTKLEVATKENSGLRCDKQELEVELEKVRVVIGAKSGGVVASSPSCSVHSLPERDVSITKPVENDKIDIIETGPTVDGDLQALMIMQQKEPTVHASPDMEFFDHIFKSSQCDDVVSSETISRHSTEIDCRSGKKQTFWENVSQPSTDVDYAEHRVSMFQLRLEEANKTIQVEREEKTLLNKALDRLQQDNNDLKLKYEEIKMSKQDTLKELSQAKAEHQDELDGIRLDLEDEASSRSSMDRRLADLRTQLERLQAENAAEWGKRERLETDKLTLERENKKLRIQIADVQDRLERKTKNGGGGSASGEIDVKALQHELHDKNKELTDLRHAHSKLKKVLQDKTTELGHTVRRAEQYETEVKKLRCRVEELKKELATAEDEIDTATNSIRKLQRTNDELQEQVDSLQVQVDHLQTRLRSNSHSLLALRGSNSLLNGGLSEDETVEF